jgi:phage shock protein A
VSDPKPDAPAPDEVEPEEAASAALPAEVTPASDPTATVAPAPVAPAETGYTPDGVPTFDYAREKIETRYGTAIGAAELAAETPEGRTVEEQYEARQRAAAEKLEQIRASMRDEPGQA